MCRQLNKKMEKIKNLFYAVMLIVMPLGLSAQDQIIEAELKTNREVLKNSKAADTAVFVFRSPVVFDKETLLKTAQLYSSFFTLSSAELDDGTLYCRFTAQQEDGFRALKRYFISCDVDVVRYKGLNYKLVEFFN